MKPLLRLLAPSALIAALFVVLFQLEPFSGADPVSESFLFEVKMDAGAAGVARLFFDRGGGFRELDSCSAKVQPGAQTVRFLVPPGEYSSFRLDPLDQPGVATIRSIRVTSIHGQEVRRFALAEWSPRRPEDRLESAADHLRLAVGPERSLGVRFERSLVLQPSISAVGAAWQFLVATALCSLLLWKFGPAFTARRAGFAALVARFVAAARSRPRLTLFCTAALAVVVACHPVIFAGRSFVSPNNRAACLYDDFPTVPGSPAAPIEDPKGSDMGAMMWAHLPYSVIEHRAIFEDRELPLWNRFNSCGLSLLGQGQSMIGDPLHWIAIVAGGASWAWDVKFILARLLFAFGIGLLVRAATGRLGVAALLTASSVFIGFFSYRFNHAATFSLCYSPWILVAWLGIARACTFRAALRPALLLVAAVWAEYQSGTAKESAMLIAGLNFAGGLAVLLARDRFATRLRRLAAGAAALIVFLLLSAPCWLVFLDSLGRAYTVYDQPRAYQIQPAQLLGLFDDLFYRQTMQHELHTNPSANFLLLLGMLWAAVSARRLIADRTFVALALAALPPFALAFGIVPPGFIERLPFIGNISHVDNTFSCVLIVLLFPLAGIGLQACRDRFSVREWHSDWIVTLVFGAILAAAWAGGTQAIARADANALAAARAALPRSSFFTGYAPALLLSLAVLPLAARALFHTRQQLLAAALVAGAAFGTIHFRHGMYGETKFDPYTMNPQVRVDLGAPSTAVEYVATHCGEPARLAGFRGVLVPGFNAIRGLEHFTGPDAILNRQHRELLAAAHVPITWEWRHLVLEENYPALHKIYDLLGVRWLLGATDEPVRSIAGLRLVGTRDLDVFESATVWPRAFFTDRLATYDTPADFAALVAASDGRPFAAIQRAGPGVAHDWSLPGDQATRQVVPAQDYRLTSNTTGFQIDTPAPGLVVLGEAWFDGDFRATLDGEAVPYVRVNHAFRGVWVGNSGHHRVEFSYWPRRLTAGLWCAAFGLFFLCILGSLALRRTALE